MSTGGFLEKRRRQHKRYISVCCFFFFEQKTAYEIYQCDWSSDVCSSDLNASSPVCFIPNVSFGVSEERVRVINQPRVSESYKIGRASCRERV